MVKNCQKYRWDRVGGVKVAEVEKKVLRVLLMVCF